MKDRYSPRDETACRAWARRYAQSHQRTDEPEERCACARPQDNDQGFCLACGGRIEPNP